MAAQKAGTCDDEAMELTTARARKRHLRRSPVWRSPWRRLRWPAGLLVAVVVYGVSGYIVIEEFSPVDALYMTMLTLTTVGFKEVQPLDEVGKWFTISLLLLGVTLVLVTLSLAAQSIAEGGLGERSRRRRMSKRIENLEGHFIVCAYGRVGRTVACELQAEGVAYVVIDADEELEQEMINDGVIYIIGDPTSEPLLQAAGIERARSLICAMDSDAANVYVTLSARAQNSKIFIVARAARDTTAERLYTAGADRVISPYVESGRHMALQALRPRVVDYLDMGSTAQSKLRVEELSIEAGSHLVGRALADICGKTTPLAVRRADGEVVANPAPSLRVGEGDLLVLLGEREALRPVEEEI